MTAGSLSGTTNALKVSRGELETTSGKGAEAASDTNMSMWLSLIAPPRSLATT